MKRITKKLLQMSTIVILIMTMILGNISINYKLVSIGKIDAEASVLSASQFTEKLNNFKASYKQGEYFNRANADGSGVINHTSPTHTNCNHTGACTLNCSCYCGTYANNCWQCVAFSMTLGDYLFGGDPRSSSEWEKIAFPTNLYVGDIVRYPCAGYHHNVVIISIDGDSAKVAECNFSGPCMVDYTRSVSVSNLISLVKNGSSEDMVWHYKGNNLTSNEVQSNNVINFVGSTSEAKEIKTIQKIWAKRTDNDSNHYAIFYIDDVAITGHIKADASNYFAVDIDPSKYSVGNHTIKIKYANSKSSWTDTRTIYFNKKVAVWNCDDGKEVEGKIKLWGKRYDSDSNHYAIFYIDDTAITGHLTADASGYFSVVIDSNKYTEGSHNFKIKYVHTAGSYESVRRIKIKHYDDTPPEIKDVKITNLSSKGYTVTCTVTGNNEIDRVQFPTWTVKDGQDDIQSSWSTNTSASGSISGTTVKYRVNITDHKNEVGDYKTHIYAYDKYGNQSVHAIDVVVPNGIVPINVGVYNGHIYAYFNDCYTWKEAKALCEGMGGHLVTITSKEENDYVHQLTANNYAYIGCTDEEKEGTWKWVTGESFSYAPWSIGQPDNSNKSEHFGEIWPDGTWNDNQNSGGYSRGFVLEIDGELKAANEVTANNYLYRAYDVSMPWEVAKVYCEKYGGSLAVPTNDAENTTIKNLIQNTKKSYYFLGITDKAKEDQWVDINGNVISYNKWGSEEPNGGISENYIVIGKNEKWYDTRSYDDFKGFIYQTQIAVTGITLNKTSLTLTEGGSETLQATIQPSNATNKTITWSSSNTSVATVDSAGKVTAVKAGTATITATSNNGKKVNCTVTVNAKTVAVTGITLNKTSVAFNVGGSETLQATIQPSNATNKTVTWSSSNTSVATVDSAGKVTAVKAGTATITATSNNSKKASCTVTVVEKQPSVSYTAHVQNTGWQSFVKDGGFAGTEGKSYRVEGIIVKLDAGSYTGGIKYRSYIQGIGWQDYVNNGSMTGTNGQSKRLEAIQIELTGDIAKYYDVYYTVHAQNYGWLGWAKNGKTSGTVGYGYRLEGIMIKLVKKGESAPSNGKTQKSYEQSDRPFINYMTYVQNEGWKESVRNGGFSGSSGKAQRIESIIMNVDSTSVSGGIRYRAMIQGNSNWTAYAADGAACGTSGQSKRLEAVQIELTGDLANKYDVYYRVYVENRGWMGWAKNGQTSGSIGYNARIEAIQIQPVVKGGAAPGSTANASVKK